MLDFGLAKAFIGDGADASLSNSPTLSMAATQQGIILGTAAYMSPEQARGQEVDKRADIWAFGCVLFEMLIGRQVYEGPTASDTLAGVLAREPDWKSLPPNLHPRIRLLLERCLEKEAKDRGHDIADVRVDIQKVLADPDGVIVQPVADRVSETPRSRLSVSIVMSVVTAIVVGLAVWYARPEPPPGDPSHFVISGSPSVPSVVLGSLSYTHLAISPDGRHIVYNADLEEGPGFYQRPVDLLEGTALTIGERMDNPFFSPDGLSLGFGVPSDLSLKKISIYGGPAETITNMPDTYQFRGASWGPDEDIIFASGAVSGLMRVPAVGGDPEVITKPAEGTQHFWPHILPNGRAVLYTIRSQAVNYQIAMLNLETGEERVLISLGSHPIYAASGHIVYGVENTLHAVPFDADELTVLGDPVPVLEDVSTVPPGATQFGLSSNGSLVYVVGTGSAALQGLALIDRDGVVERLNVPPADYRRPRVSPDGTQVVVTSFDDDRRFIWIYDLSGETAIRQMTFDGQNLAAIWTPDGEWITFASTRDAEQPDTFTTFSIYRRHADGTGVAERLTTAEEGHIHFPESYSGDGRLSFRSNEGGIARHLDPVG